MEDSSDVVLALEERIVSGENEQLNRTANISLEVIRSIGAESLRKVFVGSEWTVRVVYQMLPVEEQQYILRLMLAGNAGVRHDIISQWTIRKEKHIQVMGTLIDLGIVNEDRERVWLDESYIKNFLNVLIGKHKEPWKDMIILKPAKNKPTIDQLRQWMVWRWNNVLFYIVGESLDERAMPPDTVIQLLQSAGLMAPIEKKNRRKRGPSTLLERGESQSGKKVKIVIKGPRSEEKKEEFIIPSDEDDDDEEQIEITGKGFEFLLSVRHRQVWRLVQSLLQNSEADKKAQFIALVLNFAHCIEGEDYPVESLTTIQKEALQILFGLGLVYLKSNKATRFYPTQLGIEVALGPAYTYTVGNHIFNNLDTNDLDNIPKTAAVDQPVDIIVQTNFQVYAYTDANASSSRLVVAILSLFASLKMRLPNLVVGEISRSAIRSCKDRGIRVEQIQHFLDGHAHPLIRKKKGIANYVPPNVLDQMYLWGAEDERASFESGIYIKLPSLSIFEAAIALAKRKKALIWQGDDSRALFIQSGLEAELRSLLLSLGSQLPLFS